MPSPQQRFFQPWSRHATSGLRKRAGIKPLAMIPSSKWVKRGRNCEFTPSARMPATCDPACFCPRDKNETAGLRWPKSFLRCPTFCPKLLCEDTRRDSMARWPRPTTNLESTGLASRQTHVKEWEWREYVQHTCTTTKIAPMAHCIMGAIFVYGSGSWRIPVATRRISVAP